MQIPTSRKHSCAMSSAASTALVRPIGEAEHGGMMSFEQLAKRFRLALCGPRHQFGFRFLLHPILYMLFKGGAKKIRCRERKL